MGLIFIEIIGRSTLNKLGAIILTAHLTVKYPLNNGKVGVFGKPKHQDSCAEKEKDGGRKNKGHLL